MELLVHLEVGPLGLPKYGDTVRVTVPDGEVETLFFAVRAAVRQRLGHPLRDFPTQYLPGDAR